RLSANSDWSLRRRRELKLGVDVFEIKLGDEFLMSSLFTASEMALARLGLAELSEHGLYVVVGGLGLGYTAKAVLVHQKDDRPAEMAYSDRVRTEDLQCRYSEAKYWATTSIGWSLISRCLIRARQCGVRSAPRRWTI